MSKNTGWAAVARAATKQARMKCPGIIKSGKNKGKLKDGFKWIKNQVCPQQVGRGCPPCPELSKKEIAQVVAKIEDDSHIHRGMEGLGRSRRRRAKSGLGRAGRRRRR